MNSAVNLALAIPTPTNPTPTNPGPLYRRFELPWSRDKEESRRLRRIALIVMGTLLLLSLVIPMLPVKNIDRNSAPEIPPRLARIVIEKKQPKPVVAKKPEPVTARVEPKPAPAPPPTPIVNVQPEPVPPPPVPPPEVKPIVVNTPPPVSVQPTPQQERAKAREKARTTGLLAVADDLASLRDNNAAASTGGRRLSAAMDNNARTERALITSKQGKRSAGVNTAALSRDTGGGGLTGRSTTAVSSPVTTAAVATQAAAAAAVGTSNSGDYVGQRSQDEIETIFDKNKAAIYALYRRALRKDPTLQGKLVLELTIAPSGKVTDCKVVSSELGAPQFESSLIRRVKLFDFGAQDVQEITTTKPIDFFPA